MVGPAEASAAISGIKVALDMAKGIAALKSEKEINERVIEIQRVLLDAQAEAVTEIERRAALNRKIEELETRIDRQDEWKRLRERYVLTRTEAGAFTYNLKAEFEAEEIAHRLCATCFDQGTKSILQGYSAVDGGEVIQCQTCSKLLTIKEMAPHQVVRRPFY